MKAAILLLAVAAATAHAAEPAQCSDKAVTETVRELFWENKVRLPLPKAHQTFAAKIYASFQIRDVTPNGYDASLKRRTCEASMGTGERPFRVWYSPQLTDAGSTFVRADFRNLPDEHAIVLREIIVRDASSKP